MPLAAIPSEVLAQSISEALQSAQVFNRSVVENVCYGLQRIDPALLDTALQAAQAKLLVEGLPQGLESRIGERGTSLSTGERQRLAIARALLKRAPLLIFDEATSWAPLRWPGCSINSRVKARNAARSWSRG